MDILAKMKFKRMERKKKAAKQTTVRTSWGNVGGWGFGLEGGRWAQAGRWRRIGPCLRAAGGGLLQVESTGLMMSH